MLSLPFAEVLRSGRPEFNAQFAHARRLYPELDGEAFGMFLARTLDPWVCATHALDPGRVAAVAMAGYEVGLELVGQRIVGPAARHPAIEQGLAHLLPKVAALAASEPGLAISALSNALHELAVTPGARPGEWVATLEAALPNAEDLETLLCVGQVAAWRAGLAHYRRSALALLARLSEALAFVALGARGGDLVEIRARLENDPWFVPGVESAAPRVAGVCGAFRGFGGLFLEPPLLARSGSELLVRSGDEAWLLLADAFGATLHRATAEEIAAAREQSEFPATLRLTDGCLEYDGKRLALPATGPVTSAIFDGVTLALTSAASHGVVLVAL
jgi:hypothetical protein